MGTGLRAAAVGQDVHPWDNAAPVRDQPSLPTPPGSAARSIAGMEVATFPGRRRPSSHPRLPLMTYSVVARCERTGQIGVGVATAMHAAGKLASYARARTGALVTQANLNPYFGYDGLRELGRGRSAEETVDRLLSQDPDPESHQLAAVDARGGVAARTGQLCPSWAGDIQGPAFSVQGNRLVGREVLETMVEVMHRTESEYLVERILQALEAGAGEGGDVEGERSAHIQVMEREAYPLWDLRVDDHAEPLQELRRLYHLFEKALLPQVREMPTREEFPQNL